MLLCGGGHIPKRSLRRSQRCAVGGKLRLRLRELRQAGEHGGAAGAGAAREGATRVKVVTLQGDAPRLHRAVEGHPLRRRRILQGQGSVCVISVLRPIRAIGGHPLRLRNVLSGSGLKLWLGVQRL